MSKKSKTIMKHTRRVAPKKQPRMGTELQKQQERAALSPFVVGIVCAILTGTITPITTEVIQYAFPEKKEIANSAILEPNSCQK